MTIGVDLVENDGVNALVGVDSCNQACTTSGPCLLNSVIERQSQSLSFSFISLFTLGSVPRKNSELVGASARLRCADFFQCILCIIYGVHVSIYCGKGCTRLKPCFPVDFDTEHATVLDCEFKLCTISNMEQAEKQEALHHFRKVDNCRCGVLIQSVTSFLTGRGRDNVATF